MAARSNDGLDGNQPLNEVSVRLWKGLGRNLKDNAMVSQRSILNLLHPENQRDAHAGPGNALVLHGADAELLHREGVPPRHPFIDSNHARLPSRAVSSSAATARAGARETDQMGVEVIQDRVVAGTRIEAGRVRCVETTRRLIAALKMAVAGNSSRVMTRDEMRPRLGSHVPQAFVTAGRTPVPNGVISFGAARFHVPRSGR